MGPELTEEIMWQEIVDELMEMGFDRYEAEIFADDMIDKFDDPFGDYEDEEYEIEYE